MTPVVDVERTWARAVRALLQGHEPPAPALPRTAELEERAAGGDDDARTMLVVERTLASLPARVERALALERTPVVLADGTSLALDDAERLLAHKEERRAHRPLRASVDASLARFHPVLRQLNDLGIVPQIRSALEAFLRDSGPLRDAAREVLATVGGEPPDDAAALARALDLPDDQGAFGDEATVALLAAAREAAAPALRIARFRAPRQMAGVVLVDDEVRFAHPPNIFRFDRHMRTLEAGATALALARGQPRGRGLAWALGLSAAAARRRAGVARSTAERAARIGAAVGLLRARVEARLALVDPADARDALAEALGSDPGASLTALLATPAWDPLDDRPARALERFHAPARALALRDRFDEDYALTAQAWEEPIDVDDDALARGWAALAGELF